MGLPSASKSWKDNYLLVVVLVGFLILIAGTFWFLPPLEDKDADYERTYGRFTGNPASYITDPVIPSEPTLVPPEATAREAGKGEEGKGVVVGVNIPEEGKEGGRKEVEGKEQGGKDEDRKVATPMKLEDLIAQEEGKKKGPQVFDKQDSPTTGTAASESQTDRMEVIETRETDTEREGGGVAQVVDPVNEERRKKVVEVSVLGRVATPEVFGLFWSRAPSHNHGWRQTLPLLLFHSLMLFLPLSTSSFSLPLLSPLSPPPLSSPPSPPLPLLPPPLSPPSLTSYIFMARG